MLAGNKWPPLSYLLFNNTLFPFISQAHSDPPPTQGPLPPFLHLCGERGGFASLDEVKGREWGRCSRRPPPLPHPCIPPPIPKNGEPGGMKGGRGEGGADSVLVCLRQTRDASPPTEGTVKAVRHPPRLWIYFL
nr:hypothetical protein [Morchella crassipes]